MRVKTEPGGGKNIKNKPKTEKGANARVSKKSKSGLNSESYKKGGETAGVYGRH